MNTFPPPITEATVIETTGREAKPKRSRGLVIGLAIIGVCVVALAAVGIATAGTTTALHGSAAPVLFTPPPVETAIQKAASTCGMTSNVADNGHSITLDTEGEEDYSGDDLSDVACVTVELGVPNSLIQRMDHTRALDGVQTGEWDGLTATWNYHPDHGMMLIIEDGDL